MVKVKKEQMGQIADLFAGVWDSMLIACLQGYGGDAYADRLPDPKAAMVLSGEYSFFGGDPRAPGAKELAEALFELSGDEESVAIYAQDTMAWRDLLLRVPENHPEEVERYGIVQRDYDFDRELLQGFVDALPKGFALRPFDEDLYRQAMSEEWSREFCEVFDSCEDFLAKGFGFGAVYEGKLVAGAATMTVYDGGEETQIATRESFKRKGLALSCAAALLLECTRRNMRACWDAATLISKHIALELGYEYAGEYSTVHMHK